MIIRDKHFIFKGLVLAIFLVIAQILMFSNTLTAQPLSGNITVGGLNSNFQTISEAISELSQKGVEGPVVVNIRDGVYSEQLDIPFIPGSSNTNFITFQSESLDNTKVTLLFDPQGGDPNENFSVRINGLSNVIFQYLTIRNSSSSGSVIELVSSNNIKFQNNIIEGASNNDLTLLHSEQEEFKKVLVSNNEFRNSAQGIYLTRVNASNGSLEGEYSVTISGNEFKDQLYTAINLNSIDSVLVESNDLKSSSSSGYTGIYLYDVKNSSLVKGNKIINSLGGSGIYLDNTRNINVFNNYINLGGNNNTLGIETYDASSVDIIYNTIDINSTNVTDGKCLNVSYGNDIRVINNILSNEGGGYTIFNYYGSISQSDNNDLFSTGNYLCNAYGMDYSNLSAWRQSDGSPDFNSVSVNPDFAGIDDYHISCSDLNGNAFPIDYITTDIEGKIRHTEKPDIGACEFNLKSVDISITGFGKPESPLSQGSNEVELDLRNLGQNTINSIDIKLELNGNSTIHTWNGTIESLSNTKFSLGEHPFKRGENKLKVWIVGTGSGADENHNNDTLQISLYTALSGEYTIGGLTPDFTTIGEAAEALKASSVVAPVVFNIRDGVYDEQIVLGEIMGASEGNTITFRSESSDSTRVSIEYLSTKATLEEFDPNDNNPQPQKSSRQQITEGNFTLLLSGTSYVRFERLMFKSKGDQFGRIVDIREGSHHNAFSNCVFEGVSINESSIEHALVFSGNNADNNNIFTSNLFLKGSIGLSLTGAWGMGMGEGGYYKRWEEPEMGITIIKNTFRAQYACGVALTNQDSLVLSKNTFIANGLFTNYSAVLGNLLFKSSEVIKNRISLSNGGTGIWLQRNNNGGSVEVSSLSRSKAYSLNDFVAVVNNFITIAGSNKGIGIHLDEVENHKILYNSVNVTSNNSQSTGLYVRYGGSITYQNNVFSNAGGGLAVNVESTWSVDEANYNNYFSKGKSIVKWGDIVCDSIGALKTANSQDGSSLSVNPYFFKSEDLHLSQIALNGKAFNATEINDDIDGESRDQNTPDIGADEFTPSNIDAALVELSKPSIPFVNGVNDVNVKIKNFGNDNISSLKVGWAFNGVVQPVKTWTGNLASGKEDIFTIGSSNFSNYPNSNEIKVWVFEPNGTADGNVYNDTLSVLTYPSLSGEYTIGGANPDFVKIVDAVNFIASYGVVGNVTFKIRPGVYNEQVMIPEVLGAYGNTFVTFTTESEAGKDVTISFDPSGNEFENFLIQFNGSSNTIFKNIVFENKSTSKGRVVELLRKINNVKFLNCLFKGQTNNYDSYLVISESAIINGLNFTGNTFENGRNAVMLNGDYSNYNSSIAFDGNSFINQSSNSINIRYANKISIENNTVSSSNNNFSAINLDYTKDKLSICSNNIRTQNSGSGISLNSVESDILTGGLIANNFINFDGTYINSIYVSSSKNLNILNNTVRTNSSENSANSINIGYGCSNIVINNNILFNADKGYPLYIYNKTSVSDCDYNDIIAGNDFSIYQQGTVYNSIATWQKETGFDNHSFSVSPNFVSNTDLHVKEVLLNGSGKPSPLITLDIDHQPRNPLKPDIGADEFDASLIDAEITKIIAPVSPIKKGKHPLDVEIKNSGTDPLTSITLEWMVNQIPQQSVTWTGSVTSGKYASIKTDSILFQPNQNYNVKLKIKLPNGSMDPNPVNDTLSFLISTSLEGVYTIGGLNPDFKTISEAVSRLNRAGISSDVKFNIRDGIYSESVSIDSISGARKGYKVEFTSESKDSTKTIIEFNTDNVNYLVSLRNANNITFSNLSFRALGTNQSRVFLISGNCENIYIYSNIISGAPTTNNSNSANSLIFTENTFLKNIHLKNNIFNNASQGVYFSGISSAKISGVNIEQNRFNNQFGSALVLYNTIAPVIEKNNINSNSDYSYFDAFRFGGLESGASIVSNTININRGNCINFSSNQYNYTYIKLYNNFLRAKQGNGIYLYYSNYISIYNNSVLTEGGGIPLSFGYNVSSIYLTNNILSNFGGGYVIYLNYGSPISSSNYNDFYSTGSSLIYYGTAYQGLAQWQTARGFDKNSLSVDPLFVSKDDLHVRQFFLKSAGTEISEITTDFDGQIRGKKPDIGADEFELLPVDAGISSITNIAAGLSPINVYLSNYGKDKLINAKIGWSFDGAQQSSVSWNGSLESKDSVMVTLGTKQIDPGVAYAIKSWSFEPNGVTDLIPVNDTAKVVGKVASLSGEYTIGGTSPDYPTFTAAIDALKTYGVSNKVTFKVRDGSYNEQIIIPQISGAKANESILFRSENNDSSKVTLQFNANYDNNFILRLNKGKGISFKGIGFRSLNLNYGKVVDIIESSDLNFSNCNVEGVITTNTSEILSLFYSYNTRCNNISIQNCKLSNGSNGIFFINLDPSIGFEIKGNKFINQYYSSIYLSSLSDVSVINNNIETNSSYSGYFGVNLSSCNSNLRISKNKITDPNIANGINIQSCNSNSKGIIEISNNFVQVGGYSYSSGIKLESSKRANCYYNNINITGNSTDSKALSIYSCNEVKVLNNNIVSSAKGYCLFNSSGDYTVNSDYNNFFTTGQYIGYWNSNISSLPMWKSITSNDFHSLLVNPSYKSSTDLHISELSLIKKGLNIPEVSDDIDNDPRLLNGTTIGADEIIPVGNDAGIISLKPVKSGSSMVSVVLVNYGKDTLRSVSINWKFNSVQETPILWTGKLSKGDTVKVNLAIKNFVRGQVYNAKIWSSLPNNGVDANNVNDTLKVPSFYSTLSGVYTIGSAGCDFNSFQSAANALESFGVYDTVEFRVKPNIYNEQVKIKRFSGPTKPNTVKFISETGNPQDVNLVFSSTTSDNNYTLQLDNVSGVTFSRISIKANGASYGRAVELKNVCGDILFNNNIIVGNTVNSTSYNYALVYSYNGLLAKTNFILNTFLNGSYGMYFSLLKGSLGVKVKGNRFTNQYYSGGTFSNVSEFQFIGNSVQASSLYGGYIGVDISSCQKSIAVTNNKFIIPKGENGIKIYSCTFESADESIVANNFISLKGDYYTTGINLSSVNNLGLFYNSVYSNGTGYDCSSIALSSCSKIKNNNNNYYNAGSGYAVKVYYPDNFVESDYNNIFSDNGNLVYTNKLFKSLDEYRNLNNKDTHSISYNPRYFSTTDLHTNEIILNNRGKLISYITADIDGEARSAQTPDIGADEFNPNLLDAGVISVSTVDSLISVGNNSVYADIRNFGSDTIKTVKINWTIDGSVYDTYSWSGVLKPSEIKRVILGTKDFTYGQEHTLAAWTSLPNGIQDLVAVNDSAKIKGLYTALDGIYTIGGVTPDFSNIGNAIIYMKKGGVKNKVTFNIRDGIYNEQVTLPYVKGASRSKGVIFKSESGDSSKVILSFNAGYSNNFTIQIKNAVNTSIKGVTLVAINTTYGRVLEILNTKNVSIEQCVFQGIATTSTGDNLSLVYSSNSQDSTLIVKNSKFLNGSYGIYHSGNSSNNPIATSIENNIFENQYNTAIYLYYHKQPKIKANSIKSNLNNSKKGIYIYSCSGIYVGENLIDIDNNGYGIHMYYCSSDGKNKSIVVNNMISVKGTTGVYGLYMYNNNFVNVFHNTIKTTSDNSSSLYSEYDNNLNIKNNNIVNANNGYALNIRYSNGNVVNSDFNNVYSKGIFGYWNQNIANLDSWRTIVGKDIHSLSVNPLFLSPTDLHLRDITLNDAGTNIPDVTLDIDGDIRSTLHPDIGADEFLLVFDDDAGVTSIDKPSIPFGSGSNNVVVVLRNFGRKDLKSASIGFKVNGDFQPAFKWTGLIKPGERDTIVIGQYNFVVKQKYSITSWTELPNGIVDPFNINDTVRVDNIFAGYGGVYTIGGTNPDFTNFTEAINALKIGGVVAPITFNVRKNNYYERLIFSDIIGISKGKGVLFQSEDGDSTGVVLSYAASYGDNFVIQIKNVGNISFDNITIKALSSSYGRIVELNNASNIAFKGCLFEGQNTNSTSDNHALIYSNESSGLTFTNNLLNTGSIGVLLNNSDIAKSLNNSITNNSFIEQSGYAINGTKQNAIVIKRNRIESSKVDVTGVALANAENNVSIEKNKIILGNGKQGLNLSTFRGRSATKGLIANNFIAVIGNSEAIGIIATNPSYLNLFSNNINVVSSNLLSAALYLTDTYNFVSMNNNITNSGNGYSMYIPTNSSLITSNYNNLFSKNGGVLYNLGKPVNFLEWNSGTTDKQSISLNPYYKTNTDLHVQQISLNGKGVSVPEITTDIDNEVRNVSTPDIGADEFVPNSKNDAGILSLNDFNLPLNPGNKSIQVVIKNYGVDTLRSSKIFWKVNGANAVNFNWFGQVNPGSTDTVSVGIYNFAHSTKYQFTAWTEKPNSIDDKNAYNDSLLIDNIYAGLEGTFTIGGVNPNFKSFTEAVNTLKIAGINKTVTFKVRDGNYYEQIVLPYIKGASRNSQIIFTSEVEDSSKVALINNSGNFNYVIRLDNSKYVTFKNITIFSYYSNGIELINGAEHINLTSNIVKSYYTSGSLISSDSKSNSIKIGRNYFLNGSYAINFNGTQTSLCDSILISQNTMLSQGINGILLRYIDSFNISQNAISSQASDYNYRGIYLTNCKGSNLISSNKIACNYYGYGIYLNEIEGSDTKNTVLSNNFIMMNGDYSYNGIASENSNYIKLYFNSINTSKSGNYSNPVYLGSGNNYRILNNIIASYGTGSALRVSSNVQFESDYNNLFAKGSKLVSYTNDYSNLLAWKTASSKDIHSVSLDPRFVSPTDLHINEMQLNGKATPVDGINTDIDNQPRNSVTPDIGADEFVPPTVNDAGITALISPLKHFSAGENEIKVVIKNFGADTLRKASIKMFVNSTPSISYQWSGLILPGKSDTVSIGKSNFNKYKTHNLLLYTNIPNDVTDEDRKNDTLRVNGLCPMLNGIVLVGGQTPHFTDVKSAVDYLNNSGISSSVTFMIRRGQYDGTLNIKKIFGTSPANSITFQSEANDSLSVVIKSRSGLTLSLDSSQYITFKYLSIIKSSWVYNNVELHETGNIAFKNCNFEIENSQYSDCHIQSAGSIKGFYLLNNRFNNARSAISVTGKGIASSGIRILNNIFENQKEIPVNLESVSNIKIDHNSINSTNFNDNAIGVRAINISDTLSITENKIALPKGKGIYIANYQGLSSYRGLISNNFISLGGDNIAYGIDLNNCNLVNIFHNSINVYSTNVEQGRCINFVNNSNIAVINNIFSNSGNGYTYYSQNQVGIAMSDYNALFSKSSNIAFWTRKVLSLNDLRQVTGMEQHSIFIDPLFNSNTDLHVLQTSLDKAGTPLADVKLDIDHEQRDNLTPDIGADEFVNRLNDIGIISLLPESGCALTNNEKVKITIQNYGVNPQSDFDVFYKLNEQETVKENIGAVVINPGDSYTYTFTKPINLSSIGYYRIFAWHKMNNDERAKNDTIYKEITNSPNFNITLTPDTSICPGTSIRLSVMGGSSYLWSDGSTKSTIEVFPSKTTTYKVLARNIFGCSANDSVKVKVYSEPERPVVIPEGSTTFCYGGSVILRSSIVDNIKWSTGETLPSIKTSTSGNYTVTYRDTHGCTSKSAEILVRTEDRPYIRVSKSTICLDEIVELKAENAAIFNWSTGETQQTISVKPNATTKYKLSARTALGCTFKDSTIITVILSPATPLPVSNMSPADDQAELSLPLTLSWEGTDNARYYDLYLWKSSGSKPNNPIVYNTGSIRYNLNNVPYGESYKWQVVAKNACVETQGVVQSFGLRKLPDIKVTHVQVPQSVYSESSFDVTWDVTNVGDGNTAYQHWKDFIYLSEDTILGQDLQLGVIPNMTYLEPLQSYSKAQTFVLPKGITGNFYILVVADEQNTLLESNKQNNKSRNILPMWVKLNPPPDLRVESIITPDIVYSEHKYTIGWTVKNFGEKKATPGYWVDEVFISKDINKSAVYSLGKVAHSGELKPDSSYSNSAYVEIPKEIFGDYFIYIKTDANNNVYEHAWDYNNVKQSDSIKVLLTPPADLVISDIVTPQQVTNRATFNITWKDFNQGASNSKVTGWDDRIYLSKSPIYNLSDALVYTIHRTQNGILAGTGYDMSMPISLPKLIKPDDYYVYIETDTYSNVFEFDKENNNILRSDTTIKVITEPWADLQVLSVTVPDTAAAGDVIPISFTVINKGPAETDLSKWTDEVFISTDLSLLYSVKMGEIDRIGTVASGASYTFSGNIKIPDAMPIRENPLGSGNYCIVVRAVMDTIVYEHKFTKNNKNQSNLIFIRPSDLEVQEVTTPLTAYSGDVIPIQWVVKNKSYQTPASYWREGIVGFDCEPKNNSAKSGPIRKNDVYTIAYSYKIPDGYSGPLVLEAVADKCNFNNEKNHANNYKESNPINVILTPPCDLTVQSLNSPEVVTAGQPVEMNWIVKNSASGSTRSGGWTDLLYLSNNEILKFDRRNDMDLAGPYHQGNIAGGQSYEVKDNFTIPIEAVGNYFLKVETDYYEREYEHNAENNNLKVKQIKVIQPPPSDLIVTSVSAPTKAVAGEKLTVNWIVKNLGPNKAKGYMVDMIYFSRDSIWDIDDVLFAESSTNIDLDINKTLNRSVTTELTGTSVGDYYVIVRTDNRNNIYEVDNANNSKSTSSTVNVEVQELKMNVLTNNTLNNNIPIYYRIEIPQILESESLLIKLKGDSLNGVNELYLRYKDVPTRSTHDFAFDTPFAGNQEVIAPELKAGTYYLMVYGMHKEKKFQPISLFARILDFEIRSLKADQGGNTGNVTIQVNGSKFDNQMKLSLQNQADTIGSDNLMLINSIKLFATFNLKDKTVGLYDVKGENYQGKIAVLKKSFEIVKGNPPELGVVTVPPPTAPRSMIVKAIIEFVNAGNIDIKTPVVHLKTWDGSLLSANVEDIFKGSPEIDIPLHELYGPKDFLRPGAYGSVVVYILVKGSLGLELELPKELTNTNN